MVGKKLYRAARFIKCDHNFRYMKRKANKYKAGEALSYFFLISRIFHFSFVSSSFCHLFVSNESLFSRCRYSLEACMLVLLGGGIREEPRDRVTQRESRPYTERSEIRVSKQTNVG